MQWASDGGAKSGVRGFFFIEIKSLFSVVLLRFAPGSREAFHEHAFNAVTWFISGRISEQRLFTGGRFKRVAVTQFGPSFKPKFTPRANCHRVVSCGYAWAISFRGPWANTWREYLPLNGKFVTLTHGRKVID